MILAVVVAAIALVAAAVYVIRRRRTVGATAQSGSERTTRSWWPTYLRGTWLIGVTALLLAALAGTYLVAPDRMTPTPGDPRVAAAIVVAGATAILPTAFLIRRRIGPNATAYLIVFGAFATGGVGAAVAAIGGPESAPVTLAIVGGIVGAVSGAVWTQVDRIVAPLEARDRTLEHYTRYLDTLAHRIADTPTLRAWDAGTFSYTDLHQPATVSTSPSDTMAAGMADPYAPYRPAGDAADAAAAIDRPARRHTLVLGHPGYGKSWLLRATADRYRARVAALLAIRRPGRRLAALDTATLPVWVQLPHLTRALAGETSLDAALVAAVPSPSDDAYKAWLTGRLAGPCLLLLDSLDEVPAADTVLLRNALDRWLDAHHDTTVVVTSRPIAAARGLPRAGATQTLHLLPFDPDAVKAFVTARFRDHPGHAATVVLPQLDHPAIAGLAQVPLLLTLLCYLAHPDRTTDGQPVTLPTRRAELYRQVLHQFLTEPDRTAGDVLKSHEQHAVLEQVALTMTTTNHSDWQVAITHNDLIHAIHTALPGDERPTNAQVIGQLTAHGIMLGGGDALGRHDSEPPGYQFLHRTLHEYLLASALASDPDARHRLVAAHRWFDDEWRDVLLLLASQPCSETFDPDTYLQDLATDDCDAFWHGLFLAAHAAAEHPTPAVSNIVIDIIERVHARTTTPSRAFADAAARALGPLSAAGHPDAVAHAISYLTHDDANVRDAAAEALSATTDQAATKALIDGLTLDTDPAARYAAALALRGATDRNACAALVDRLTHETEEFVRRAAAVALQGITNPGVLTMLADRLTHGSDADIRCAAAEALRGAASSDATAALVDRLVCDADHTVRAAAAIALQGTTDRETVTMLVDRLKHGRDAGLLAAVALQRTSDPDTTAALVDRLTHRTDAAARYAAALALGRTDDPNATAALVDRLTHDRHDLVRRAAAEALEGTADPDATAALVDRLTHDTDEFVRRAAAVALQGTTDPDATAALVDRLTHDRNDLVRHAAAVALQGTTDPNATTALIDRLTHDRNDLVRRAAAEALEGTTDPNATAALVDGLAHDTDTDTRYAAALALRRTDDPNATAALVDRLTHDRHDLVRHAAAEALEGTTDPNATTALIDRLTHDRNDLVRHAAAEALEGTSQLDTVVAVVDRLIGLSDADRARAGRTIRWDAFAMPAIDRRRRCDLARATRQVEGRS